VRTHLFEHLIHDSPGRRCPAGTRRQRSGTFWKRVNPCSRMFTMSMNAWM
jgi:hypothetical protein